MKTDESVEINLMGSVVSIADMSKLKIGSGKRIKIFGNPDRTNTPKPVGLG